MNGQRDQLMTVSTPDDGLSPATVTDPTVTRCELVADLRYLGYIGGPRSAGSTDTVAKGYERVAECVDKRLPLAELRRDEAAGSPADQERWDRIIKAATTRPRTSDASYEGLVLAVSDARELLRALVSTHPPFVPIARVGQLIAKQINAGTYPPGALLSAAKLAAELGLKVDSVRLALTDLINDGTVEALPHNRVRVPGPHPGNDRPQQLAWLMRELVAAGVYPQETVLPPLKQLARVLVTTQEDLTEALCLLVEDGTLERTPHRRPVVRGTVTAASSATRPLLRPADVAKDVDLSAAGIREAALRAGAWWSTRLTPSSSQHGCCIDHLCAAGHHLAARARCFLSAAGAAEHPDVEQVIARVEATAAAVSHLEFSGLSLWTTACLAAAVRELLGVVEQLEATHANDGHLVLHHPLLSRVWCPPDGDVGSSYRLARQARVPAPSPLSLRSETRSQ
ncbi:GntR family transcriptional regulator [Streptomyces sp. NPDC093589]|uniref:GntR family transcriptional regulator n=1 Tax=Streptomyces sp. NPDC093589 TaxID=3366043 RepID=UPI003803D29D